MKISKVFYAALAIGMIIGVCLMMIANGLFGDTEMRDVIGSVLILGSISGGALIILRNKLSLEWDSPIAVHTPIKDWWRRNINADFPPKYDAECYTCNLETCIGCPLFEKEVK